MKVIKFNTMTLNNPPPPQKKKFKENISYEYMYTRNTF